MAEELELWDDNQDDNTSEITTETEEKTEETSKGEGELQPKAEEVKVETKVEETTVVPDKELAVEFSAEDKEVVKTLKSKKTEELTEEEQELITAYDESVPKVEINFDRLKERGYLQIPENFTFDGTEEKEEELLAYNEGLKRKAFAEELYSEIPEDFKPVLEYVLAGGTDYKSIINNSDISTITDEELDEAKAEVVLHKLYKDKGFQEAKIKKLINVAKQDDSLIPEAKDALATFKQQSTEANKAKVEAQKATKAKEVADAQENQRIYINTVKKLTEVAGYKVTDADKQKLINSNLKPVRINTEDGPVETTLFNYKLNQYMNDPEKFVKLQFFIESDFNIPNQAKRADTEAIKKLQEKLKLIGKEDTQGKVRSGKSSVSKTNFDLEKAEMGS